MGVLNIEIELYIANHLLIDRQTEVANKILEECLLVSCNFRQLNRDEHLPTAEFAHSSSIFPATESVYFTQ